MTQERGFAMSVASKEWLLGSDRLIGRRTFIFDCWECMYYVQVTIFFLLQFQFYLEILDYNTLKMYCKVQNVIDVNFFPAFSFEISDKFSYVLK